MRAFVILLGLVVVGLAGFVTYTAMRPAPEPGLDEAAIRALVGDMLAARDSAAAATAAAVPAPLPAQGPIETAVIDPAILNPMIEDYLMGDPRILQRLSDKLQGEIRTAEAAAAKAAITSMQAQIFEDPDQIVVGNPNGDVTLVEMFDYNCGYCRAALPDLATLIAEDPGLKVILKEFPILSRESVDAARVAVLVSQQPDVDYWAFHSAMFSGRGAASRQTALGVARELGLNPVTLELGVDSEAVTAIIQKSYEIAEALNISGTPTYIIGDEIIPGAIGVDELRLRIKNMRACGATTCDDSPPPVVDGSTLSIEPEPAAAMAPS